VLGGAETESTTAQLQNIFDFVRSSAWISRPMTGSYSMTICHYCIKSQDQQQPQGKSQLYTGLNSMSSNLSGIPVPDEVEVWEEKRHEPQHQPECA